MKSKPKGAWGIATRPAARRGRRERGQRRNSGTIWVRGAVLPPDFLEPAPQLSEARRNGEKTPHELATPAAPRKCRRGAEEDYA